MLKDLCTSCLPGEMSLFQFWWQQQVLYQLWLGNYCCQYPFLFPIRFFWNLRKYWFKKKKNHFELRLSFSFWFSVQNLSPVQVHFSRSYQHNNFLQMLQVMTPFLTAKLAGQYVAVDAVGLLMSTLQVHCQQVRSYL